MTILLAYIVCSICSFLLAKSHLETVFKPYGEVAKAWRQSHLKDPETTKEDGVLNAIFWTSILVLNILAWPIVLCVMVWYKIFPEDFIEEGGN